MQKAKDDQYLKTKTSEVLVLKMLILKEKFHICWKAKLGSIFGFKNLVSEKGLYFPKCHDPHSKFVFKYAPDCN